MSDGRAQEASEEASNDDADQDIESVGATITTTTTDRVEYQPPLAAVVVADTIEDALKQSALLDLSTLSLRELRSAHCVYVLKPATTKICCCGPLRISQNAPLTLESMQTPLRTPGQ